MGEEFLDNGKLHWLFMMIYQSMRCISSVIITDDLLEEKLILVMYFIYILDC